MSFASACNLVVFLVRGALRRGNGAMRQRRGPRGLVEAMRRDRVCSSGFQGSGQALGHSIQVEFVCRIGDDDAVRGKASLDLGAESVPHVARQAGFGDERVKREQQRGFSKAFQRRRRRRVDHNIRVRARDSEQKAHDPLGVCSVGNAYFDRHPQYLVLERPVYQVAGDELAVRNDHALVV
jgi:hypothetical protein